MNPELYSMCCSLLPPAGDAKRQDCEVSGHPRRCWTTSWTRLGTACGSNWLWGLCSWCTQGRAPLIGMFCLAATRVVAKSNLATRDAA